jgi:hypothetical protein
MPAEKKPGSEKEPAWSFDSQGDYAVDRGQRRERIAALAVAALWVGLIFYNSGLGYAIRGVAGFGLGVAAIWWPDAMSQWRGDRWTPRAAFDREVAGDSRVLPGGTRLAGWGILIMPALVWGVVKLMKMMG